MINITTIADTAPYKISTRLLMQAALRKGYTLTYFPSSPVTESGITRGEKGRKEIFFKSTCIALTPAFGVHAAENKCLTHSMLTAYSVNTPEIATVAYKGEIEPGLEMLKKHQRVVVKPAQMNHGDGITVNVTTQKGLVDAITYARETAGSQDDIIIQRQVDGEEYRFLVVSGKVIAVARRRPPYVVGDGKSTILELLEEKNRDPRRGKGHGNVLTAISIDDVAHHKGDDFLKRVLPDGEEVNVLDTSNLSRGGESVDFTDIASPELKKMAVIAAESCFLGVAGVDIMTSDITSSSLDDSYVIEVNLTPGIRMHQFPSVGQARDVVTPIFAAIEKTARPVSGKIKHIGRSDTVALPELAMENIYSRIDTGARTSAIWVSQAKEHDGVLKVIFFGPQSAHYTGKIIEFKEFDKIAVATSIGHVQIRYKIRLLVKLKGKKIRAWFTLADRSTQVYPMLIGRNVLMGKFIVDVQKGRILKQEEEKRIKSLDAIARETEE